MNHQELKDFLAERYGDDIVILEPEYYDEAIVGTDQVGRLIYSYEKLIETISSHDGMSYEEAMEWVDYNTIRAIPYMGEFKPVMLMEFPDCDDEWLVGASTDGEPIYYYDNVPDKPVKHQCLEDYWLLDSGEALPDPIIMYPLDV